MWKPLRRREKKISESRETSRASQPDAQVLPGSSGIDKTAALNFVPGGNATPELEDKDGIKAPDHPGPRYPRQPSQEPIQTLFLGDEPAPNNCWYGKKQR